VRLFFGAVTALPLTRIHRSGDRLCKQLFSPLADDPADATAGPDCDLSRPAAAAPGRARTCCRAGAAN
jgi:hypothetical protein